jgi:hypothetical protein
MDLRRKLEIVDQAIKSISTHSDVDSAVVAAALDRIDTIVQAERERISSMHAELVAALDEPKHKKK